MRSILILALFASLAFAACDDGSKIIGIDDTGVVRGLAYVDRDGNGVVSAADASAQGVAAALVLEATGDTVARANTRADGTFTMTDIPVGRYRLVAALGTIGDTLAIEQVVEPEVSVAARDTADRFIRLSYPTIEVTAVRELPVGRRVIVAGIALNGWTTFGDSTVHVQDATGVIRTVRVLPSTLQAGDSVRILGSTGTASGQVVLADASAQIPAPARGLPAVDSVSTASAYRADGVHENGQARIAGALVLDTTMAAGDLVLSVDDGSGPIEVVLDQDIQFNAAEYVPGATFSGVGVLIPGSVSGTWRLKPRERNEAVITFPAITIAAARAASVGSRVVVQGLALNAVAAFGDSTLHITDGTGSIRSIRVSGTAAAGDSVRVLGTMTTREGQPAITSATAAVIRTAVGLPDPDSIATGTAAAAEAGTRDAAQVRVSGIIVSSQTQTNGDLVLGVDDGSGRVDVLFDNDIGFDSTALVPGALLDAAGVLVPSGTGTWRLKPRNPADAIATYQTVTVAEARDLATGRTVYVEGIALNGWVTFGDATVHVQDPTSAIRIINLPSASIFAGDSIRILGTVSVQRGQPVLTGVSSSVLLSGVGLPTTDSVSTAVAAGANAGAMDAHQAAVSGTISSVVTSGGDVILTISDGSGDLKVVLDKDVGFSTGAYTAGGSIRARGLLVPNAAGTMWELKPRTIGDVAVTTG